MDTLTPTSLNHNLPMGKEHYDTLRALRIERQVPVDVLKVQKLNEHATIPTFGSGKAAGLDLYANFAAMEDLWGTYMLYPGERKLFKTGLAISCPPGTYGRVAPRSGLAYKHGIDVMAGVIDEDYTGDVGVILINHGEDDYVIKHGDKIAQLIVTQITPCLPMEVASLDESVRGDGGYGSTGQ